MDRCGTCSFWEEEDEENWEQLWRENDLELGRMKVIWEISHYAPGMGVCNCPKFVYDNTSSDEASKTPVDGLGYVDGEHCHAIFWTGREFGCLHHENRAD